MATALGSSNIRGYQSTMSVLVGYVDNMSSQELLMAFRLTLNLLERIGELMNKNQEQPKPPLHSFNPKSFGHNRIPNNMNTQNNYRRSLLTNVGSSDGPVITSVASSHRSINAMNRHMSPNIRGNVYSPRMGNMGNQYTPRMRQPSPNSAPNYRVIQSNRSPAAMPTNNMPRNHSMMRPPALQPSPGNLPSSIVPASYNSAHKKPAVIEPKKLINITEPIELSDDEDSSAPDVVPAKVSRIEASSSNPSTSATSSSTARSTSVASPVTTPVSATHTSSSTPANTQSTTPKITEVATAVSNGTESAATTNTSSTNNAISESSDRERSDAVISQTPGRSIIQKLNHLLDSSERVTSSGQTIYICPICKKDYTIRASIRYHLRVIHFKMHLKEKDVQCRRCGRRFTSVGAVNRHLIRCTHQSLPNLNNCRRAGSVLPHPRSEDEKDDDEEEEEDEDDEEEEEVTEQSGAILSPSETLEPVMPSLMKGSEVSMAPDANEGSSSSSSVLTSIELNKSNVPEPI